MGIWAKCPNLHHRPGNHARASLLDEVCVRARNVGRLSSFGQLIDVLRWRLPSVAANGLLVRSPLGLVYTVVLHCIVSFKIFRSIWETTGGLKLFRPHSMRNRMNRAFHNNVG